VAADPRRNTFTATDAATSTEIFPAGGGLLRAIQIENVDRLGPPLLVRISAGRPGRGILLVQGWIRGSQVSAEILAKAWHGEFPTNPSTDIVVSVRNDSGADAGYVVEWLIE